MRALVIEDDSSFRSMVGEAFKDDGFAIVFRLGPAPGTMLRVVRVPPFTPLPFTVLGWETLDLDRAVGDLTLAGVTFLRFPNLQQSDIGIWSAPDGSRVAWFHDPDGNTLSLSQHPA